MRLRTILVSSACSASLLFGVGQAQAQTSPLAPAPVAVDTGAGDDPGDIIVSARKRDESVVDTPLSISAYRGEALQDRGVPTLHQLDTISPSLTITNFGAGNVSDATLFIRGIGTADHLILTDPGVGVYLDGVYLGRAMGANMSLMNLDHVEVLRGPQGTLSGRNTLGGAVNIVTKQPSQDEHYEFTGSIATRADANVGFYGTAPITDTLAVSLSGQFEHRNGIGRFINLPSTGEKVGEIDKGGGRFAAKWTPSQTVSVLFSVDGSSGHYGLSPMYNVIINPNGGSGLTQADLPANRDDSGTTNPEIPHTSSKDLGFSLIPTIKLDEHLTLKLIGSERYSHYKGGLDDDDSPIRYSEFPETGYARQYTGEAMLNGEYGRFNFVTGAYYFHEKGNANQPDYIFAGEQDQFFVDQTTNSYAFYAHGGFDINDRLKLSGGVRYTDDRKRAFAYIGCCLNPGVTRRNSWNAVTWDAALDYKITPALAAYATVQRGYESGGYPARPFGGASTFVAYNPTYATNYEAGLKGRIGDVLRFSSAVFYTQYKDLALQFSQAVPDVGYVTITANAGRSRTWGAEFEGDLKISQMLSLTATAGYNNAKVTKVAAGTVGVAAGDVPQLTPRWTVAGGPQLSVPLASGAIVTARIDESYRSGMFGQSANNAYNRIAGRSLTNFDISYKIPSKNLTLSVFGTNIFDKVYDVSRIDQFDTGFTEIVRSNDRSEFGVRVRKAF